MVTGSTAGSVTVKYTVTNSCGAASATRSLTVNGAPNAGTISGISSTICINSTSTFASNGTSGGTWSSTNTTVMTINASTGAATAHAVGTTTIKYTVTNNCGISTASKNVQVAADTKSPTVACPGNISQNATGNNCNKSISVNNPSLNDNCGVQTLTWKMTGATITNSPSTGINYVGTKTFNVGTTTVMYTATDAAGNTATCSFTVTVVNPNCSASLAIAEKLPEPFNVKIMNNPSLIGTDFILQAQSDKTDLITIKVVNMLGAEVYQTKGSTNQTYRFGALFISGMYIVEVLHNNEVTTYKIVKGG